jgi:hypothetical protein
MLFISDLCKNQNVNINLNPCRRGLLKLGFCLVKAVGNKLITFCSWSFLVSLHLSVL